MKTVAYVSGSILLLNVLHSIFVSEWYWANAYLNSAMIAVGSIALGIFAAALIGIGTRLTHIFVLTAIVFCCITGCFSCSEHRPIDSEWTPIELDVVKNLGSYTLIKRGIYNGKHGTWTYDTIAVKDKWIFRKRI